jgi:hypothetical protein
VRATSGSSGKCTRTTTDSAESRSQRAEEVVQVVVHVPVDVHLVERRIADREAIVARGEAVASG